MPNAEKSSQNGTRIAALYVDPAGPYVGLDGVDPWDESRDARGYRGADPVVAHPPCERWGRFARGSPKSQRFEVGDDGGCFEAALLAVRRVGGVIEHPQGSHAWRRFHLPIPSGKGWTHADLYGGRSCYVDQGAYGHLAKKPTWLYAVLPAFPALDWTRVWGLAYIGGAGYHSAAERAKAKARVVPRPERAQVPKHLNHITPPEFRDALIKLAKSCGGWVPSGPRALQETLTEVPTDA